MSSMRADTHLFGSRGGYRSLAKSPGISAAEDRALSEFGFGQSSDEDFLRRLATVPTAFARTLPGGRIGITRVLAGPLDDSGRATLERRTVVLPIGDYRAIRRGMGQFLLDARLWSSGDFASGRPVQCPVPSAEPVELSDHAWRVFDAWVSALQRPPHGVVVGSGEDASAAILAVLASLRDEDVGAFSWGVGLLAPIAWVDVMSISRRGTTDGSRPVFTVGRSGCVNEAVVSARRSRPSSLPSLAELRGVSLVGDEAGAGGSWGLGRGSLDDSESAVEPGRAWSRPAILVGAGFAVVTLAALVFLVFALKPGAGGGQASAPLVTLPPVPAGGDSQPALPGPPSEQAQASAGPQPSQEQRAVAIAVAPEAFSTSVIWAISSSTSSVVPSDSHNRMASASVS